MTQFGGLDTLFNPAKRHMDEERLRLQSTREEVGDASGGKRIDFASGKVRIGKPKAAAATSSEDPVAATDTPAATDTVAAADSPAAVADPSTLEDSSGLAAAANADAAAATAVEDAVVDAEPADPIRSADRP